MAITYNTYFSNAIVGQPMAGADIDVMEVNTTPKYAVGFGFVRADGAKFRYCCFSAATPQNTVVAPHPSRALITTANGVTAPASAVAVSGDNITVGNTGSRYIEVLLAGVSANQLAGNTIVIYGGTGAGYSYRVKGNTLTGSIGSGLVRIQLYEPLVDAVAADTDIALFGSIYNDVIAAVANVGSANTIAGISCGSVNAAGSFGWVMEEGVIGCRQSLGVTGGQGLIIGTTAGSVAPALSITTENIIGRALWDGGAAGIGVCRIKAI